MEIAIPYSPSQNKLFRAAAHDPAIAKSSGIPQAKAAEMADEGVKPQSGAGKRKALVKAIMGQLKT